MNNITFTNNLGSITFLRFMLSIEDAWEWDGRRVKMTKQINVDAYVSQSEAENLSSIFTPTTTKTGQLGSLTIPWTTLTNVKPTSISYGESNWIDYVRVSASFVDEYPENQTYVITWFGLTLNNPRISVSVPTTVLKDDYTQMPTGSSVFFNLAGLGAGVLRTKAGPGLMEISVSGSTPMTYEQLITSDVINTLVQRAAVGLHVPPNEYVQAGYPGPFPMSTASPELAVKLPLVQLIVAGGTLSWDIEMEQATISMQLLTQPQTIYEGGG